MLSGQSNLFDNYLRESSPDNNQIITVIVTSGDLLSTRDYYFKFIDEMGNTEDCNSDGLFVFQCTPEYINGGF